MKNAPTVFFEVVFTTFKEFIDKFLEVYLDDWTMFILLKGHIKTMFLMLDRCRQFHISLNLKKCIFCAPFGIILGHVVCKQGILVYPVDIVVIVDLQALTSVRKLRQKMGHMGY